MKPDTTKTKTFKSTKVVKALPMTRGDYNKYRGWLLPKDENGADAGYLVEYTDGGPVNVVGHEGYVSWSPADVFERVYFEYDPSVAEPPEPTDEDAPTTWVDRLMAEGADLAARLAKLEAFMKTQTYDELPLPDRELLTAQQTYMTKYLDVLGQRAARVATADGE